MGNVANGQGTHIEGADNTVNTWNDPYNISESHVEGTNNTIQSIYSHVEGTWNTIKLKSTNLPAKCIHLEGTYNVTSSDYQHVQGKYNVEDTSDTYADIIGNGTADDARFNAYNMDWYGNAEFQGEVYVGGCTPNGETPYPVVRYNTSNSQQEYYDGSNWAQVPSGGGIVPGSITPQMDGTGAVGTSAKYAREDHVHPSDTTKYSINNYGQGTTDVSIRPLVAGARANRLAFLPADQIIIEKTTDGGVTWEDAGIADNTKLGMFATRNGTTAIPLLNGEKSTLCGVRITITAMKYNVPSGTAETEKYNYWNSTYINKAERYTNLREMWFWVSTNNDALRVQVSAATGANPNNWNNVFNRDFALKGWSGSDWVRLDGKTFGGSITQTSNYWNWRITFWSRMNDGASAFASTSQQYVYGIQGYGDSWWNAPNGMMKEDHLYTWDINQNATFPANVTATQFIGALSGNATSATTATTATKATQDESGNNIKASYASSMSLNGSVLSLNNKNGTTLNSVTLPSGGGGSWTELWTNPDPTSNFAAQTVSVDLSAWTWIAIRIIPNTNNDGDETQFAMVGRSTILEASNYGSNQYKYMRKATVSTSGVQFSTGYRNTTGTSGTGYAIPQAIYGVC